MMRRPSHWNGPVLVATIGVVSVALAGGASTDLGPWYSGLKTPAWKPPDAAFPVIWTGIFVLTAVAGVLAWCRPNGPSRRLWLHRQSVMVAFLLNGLLNILWSVTFFQVRRPDLALVENAGLWLSILAMTVVVWRQSKLAGTLLLPYLLWGAIAFRLNYEVVVLNGPFG